MIKFSILLFSLIFILASARQVRVKVENGKTIVFDQVSYKCQKIK